MDKNKIFTPENFAKAVYGTAIAASLYFAIKSDIRNMQTEKKYEVDHLQYQINELKKCCDEKEIVFNQPLPQIPKAVRQKELKFNRYGQY